jgi:hypothetical protein
MRWASRCFCALGFALPAIAPARAAEPAFWPVAAEPHGFVYIDAAGHRHLGGPFAHAAAFSEGLARAAPKLGQYGYLDGAGLWRIAPHYDDARDFHEGAAAVALRGPGEPYTLGPPWGFIDATGKLVIAPRFGATGDFSEGLAAVTSRVDGAKWGFIDRTGKLVIAPQFNEVGRFIHGRARAAMLGADGSHVEGFIGPDGRWAIAPQYREVEDFSDGLAAVSVDGRSGLQCSYVDPTGGSAIAGPFVHCGPFRDGLAGVMTERVVDGHVKRDGVFINRSGAVAIPGPFGKVGDFSGGLAPVARNPGDWYFIDRTGKTISDSATVRLKVKTRVTFAAANAFEGPLAQVWGYARGWDPTTVLWLDRKGKIVWRFRPSRWSPSGPEDPVPRL